MKWIGSLLLVLVLLGGCAAWVTGLAYRSYDFDEVQRAHSIWMASQGLRPYSDFLECHPPYFALLGPVAQGQFEPKRMLLTLRAIAAVGNLFFLAGLVTAAVTVAGAGRTAAILGTALVAFNPAALEFLSEFRIDGWGYAIAIWSVVRLLRSRGEWRYLEFGLTTGIATLLFSPKLTLLTPMIVVLEVVKERGSVKTAVRTAGTYTAGVTAACLLFWIYLAMNGIGLQETFAFLVRYHVLANAHSSFGYGLFRMAAAVPLLSLPILLGELAWMVHCVRTKSAPDSYTGALAIWLVLQLMLVSYPYKQYSGAWLLFASAFLPFLAMSFKFLPRQVTAGVFVCLCAFSIWTSVATARPWAAAKASRQQEAVLRFMNAVSDPADRVVASPPCHPIDRRDTFYIWFNTVDPAHYGTEGILDAMPPYRDLVSDQTYRRELDSNPPAFVAVDFWSLYPPRQRAVLQNYLDERAYVHATVGGMRFAVRPDRYGRFAEARQVP